MIEFIGISKSFGTFTALRNVNLKLPDNAFVSLLGPSGCGKTTLLRLLAGFIQPDAGSIIVGDREISNARSSVPPEQRAMGMVFQTFAVWPHMTVHENVAFGLRLQKLPKQEINERTRDALALAKLAGLETRYPSQLSGGQQQRVAIARSIVVRPKILLLDEPLSSLDTQLRQAMLLELRELQTKLGIAFVYVTHDQGEALMASDEIVMLRQGIVEQRGTPRELYESPATRFVAEFLGGSTMIEGLCTDIRGALAVVEISPQLTLVCKAGAVVRRNRVAVCIRSDAGRIIDGPGSGENELPARILDCRYGGTFQRLLVDLGPASISVTAAPSLAFASRDVRLQLDPLRCLAFPL